MKEYMKLKYITEFYMGGKKITFIDTFKIFMEMKLGLCVSALPNNVFWLTLHSSQHTK